MMTKKEKALKWLRKPLDFGSMTPKERRVAIAKDVLAGLDAEKLVAGNGYGHFVNADGIALARSNASVREEMGRADKCVACALGNACFALVGRVNILKTDAYGAVDDDHFRPMLRKHFSSLQLAMIESAYEVCDYSNREGCRSADVDSAIAFGRRNEGRDARMRAIFENIVQHGEFRP